MQMPEGPICQSCCMPMAKPEDFGTEANGSASKDYCTHCYEEGKFTNPNLTLDGMMNYLAPSWGEWTERPNLTAEQAKPEISGILSNLKRWKQL